MRRTTRILMVLLLLVSASTQMGCLEGCDGGTCCQCAGQRYRTSPENCRRLCQAECPEEGAQCVPCAGFAEIGPLLDRLGEVELALIDDGGLGLRLEVGGATVRWLGAEGPMRLRGRVAVGEDQRIGALALAVPTIALEAAKVAALVPRLGQAMAGAALDRWPRDLELVFDGPRRTLTITRGPYPSELECRSECCLPLLVELIWLPSEGRDVVHRLAGVPAASPEQIRELAARLAGRLP